MEADNSANVVAVLFANNVPPPNYDPVNDPAGPYSITRDVLSLDPFLLPILAGTQVVVPSTLTTLPARSSIIVPNLSTGPEGIVAYETQNSGNNVIDQVIATPNPSQNDLTIGSPTQMESGANTAASIYLIDLSFRQDNSGPTLSTYGLAWDQYNGTNYSIDFQIFNADGTTSSPVETPVSFTTFNGANISATPGANGATNLPGWEFRNGGGIYALAVAEYNSATKKDFIQFTGYNLNGTVNTTNSTDLESFQISSDLSHYTNATNLITQDVIPSLSPTPGGPSHQLEFIQASANNANDWLVAWNETVVDATTGNFLGDQVEFVVDKPGTGLINIGSATHFTVQLTDAQNVHLTDYTAGTNDFVVLAYGDATATHLIEFEISGSGGTVTQVASITDPTTQPFNSVTSLGDGRIAVEYDNVLDTSQTSQYDTKIFDFRTAGLNNPALSTTQANYIAGTQFGDTVTGATGVNNLYYYVGEDAAYGTGSSNSFTGGSGGWNIAILPDARSDYSLTTNASDVTTIASNSNDPAHLGSLAVSNVQVLAFDPAADPTPHNGTIDVNGGTYVILGNYAGAVTIEAGATSELDISASGATSYTGSVTFEAATGTAQFDQPAEFTGTISGSAPGGMLTSGDVLQLVGYDSSTTATPGTFNGTTTPLTVTDPGHTTLSLTLTGNYSSSTFTATAVSGGVDIVDPPATAAAIANGATLDVNAPSSETVTFNGGTGSLVLDQPSTFSGQISGFTGTAPDPTQSDTIDLVNINYNSVHFSETYNTSSGVLGVSDGSTTASLTFDNFNGTLDFASDGNGGTLITDPPKTNSSAELPLPSTQDSAVGWGINFGKDQIDWRSDLTAQQFVDGSLSNGPDPGSNQPGLVSLGGFHQNVGADIEGAFSHKVDTDEHLSHPHNRTAQQLTSHVAVNAHVYEVTAGMLGYASIAQAAASTVVNDDSTPDRDQNGLLTNTFLLGSDPAIDLSGNGGVQTIFLMADTHALGGDDGIAPPAVTSGLSGDQGILPPDDTSGLNEHGIAPPAVTSGLGGDQGIVPPDNTSGLNEHGIAPPAVTSGLGGDQNEHGIAPPAVTSGLGGDQNEPGIAPSAVTSGLGGDQNEHGIAPPAVTSGLGGDHANMPNFSGPTLATATFGALGNDNFVFRSSLGGQSTPIFDSHAADLEHGKGQNGSQAFAPSAHDVASEIMFGPGHLDVADLTKTAIDQFHQLVANVTHLH